MDEGTRKCSRSGGICNIKFAFPGKLDRGSPIQGFGPKNFKGVFSETQVWRIWGLNFRQNGLVVLMMTSQECSVRKHNILWYITLVYIVGYYSQGNHFFCNWLLIFSFGLSIFLSMTWHTCKCLLWIDYNLVTIMCLL